MNIAILHLVSNDYVICDLEMLEEEPCYFLKNAQRITENNKGELEFNKYPSYTEDEGCLLHTDKIITMADPEPRIVESYMKVIGD